MIFIERYPLKRCQGFVKLIASKVNCFLNINDLSEVQLCMSSNSWTWECPHTKDGADHVPLIFVSSVCIQHVHVVGLGGSTISGAGLVPKRKTWLRVGPQNRVFYKSLGSGNWVFYWSRGIRYRNRVFEALVSRTDACRYTIL